MKESQGDHRLWWMYETESDIEVDNSHREYFGVELFPLEADDETINAYIEEAMDTPHLSLRGLARRLNISPSTLIQWRNRKSWPTDEKMLDLAAEAGEDPLIALAHVNFWRAKSKEIRKHYWTLLRLLYALRHKVDVALIFGVVLSSLLNLAFFSPTEAREHDAYRVSPTLAEICIMREIARIASRWFRRCCSSRAPLFTAC
jgi:transcriptional regulator with XRE-family HTH domain